MASTAITPTRMVLNQLKGRLKTARRGHKLLKDKRDELMRQFLDIVRLNQQLRTKVKPGLLPPFYYDRHTPETIDEVQASERKYIEAYLKAPLRTDFRYFFGTIGNIIFRRKRSH